MSATGGRTVRVAVSEGRANVASSPLRSALVAVVAGLVSALVVVLSTVEVAGITQRYRAQVAAGRFVLVARSPSRDGLDAARCDALRDLPGVRSAGAVVDHGSVYPVAAPLRPYDQLTVTPGLLGVWFPAAPVPVGRGLIVGAEAARELGLIDGSVVQTAATGARSQATLPARAIERTRVRSVLPGAVRYPEAGRMIFEVTAPAGTAAACFVDPDPSARPAVEAALLGWFGVDQPASVTPYLDEQIAGRLPEDELAGRATRWVWLAASGVLLALVVVLWYGRRDELALYRLLGLGRGAIAVVLLSETVLTVTVPVLVGGSLALVGCTVQLEAASRSDGGVSSLAPLVGADAASFALVLALTPLAGAAVTLWRSTFDVLKGL